MFCRRLFGFAVALSALAFWFPSASAGGELCSRWKAHAHRVPEGAACPPAAMAPGAGYRQPKPDYSPWYTDSLYGPAFRWGYFGAREHKSCTSHTGYYGDYTQLGWWKGN